MDTESMAKDCVATYYATLAGLSYERLNVLDSVRLSRFKDLFSKGCQPDLALTWHDGASELQRRVIECASNAGYYQFTIRRMTFLEANGDVLIAVKAMLAIEFVELFVTTAIGGKLFIKQQSYSEADFVR
ncbi:hypothetical protein [Luteibacter yeojuensis]